MKSLIFEFFCRKTVGNRCPDVGGNGGSGLFLAENERSPQGAKQGVWGRKFWTPDAGLPVKSSGSRLRSKDGSVQIAEKRHQTFVIIWAYERCFASFGKSRNAASPVFYGTCEYPRQDSDL